MKCKKCRNVIEDDSIYCKFCGEKLIRTRQDKQDIKVPKPKQLPSGSWFARVTYQGERVPVTAPTEQEYYAKARAIKTGMIEVAKAPKKITLHKCIEEYIDVMRGGCAKSTIAGYNRILKHRFPDYMEKTIDSIDWQRMISDEASRNVPVSTRKNVSGETDGKTKKLSAKTIENAWGLVCPAIARYDIRATVTLPQVINKPAKWIEDQNLDAFCAALEHTGRNPFSLDAKIGVLLALHGLRRSEVYAVTRKDIRGGYIYVEGAMTESDDGYVLVETNKNSTSRRKVPISIPLLQELVDNSGREPDELLVQEHPNTLYKQINRACRIAGIDKVGVHGLRKTYASEAYKNSVSEHELMRLGGWKDVHTMHKVYIQVSDKELDEAGGKLKQRFTKCENGNENGND